MDYSQLEKYEYKAPSYALLNRTPSVNHQEHAKKRRFFYDAQSNSFRSSAPGKDSISMLFCGDLLCQERMLAKYQTKDGTYDFTPCFTYIKPLLRSADFAAGNLETSISHTAPYRGEILTHEGPYYCNAPLEYLAALSDAGFDMLTTENNHTLDAGVRGLAETIENIQNFGLLQTGTFTKEEDKFLIVDICGFKVGFTAFGTGDYNTMQTNLTPEGIDTLLNTYSPARAEAICRAMREKGAEYLICFPHWGTEYTDVLTRKQTTIASELTAIGFDLILGSHAHVIQKLRVVNETPVVFSMGNLISHLNTSGKQDVPLSVLCRVTLKRSDSHINSSLEFIPCKILKNFNGIPYTVVPLSEALGTPELLGSAAEDIRNAVVSRLECEPSQVITNVSLRPDCISDYRTERSAISTKLDNLRTIQKKNIKPAPIIVPKKHFWDSCTGYLEERNALYKLFPNHAELILVTRTTEVLTLPTDVAQRPVEIISSGCANKTARIVYLGKKVKILKDAAFQNYTQLESIRLYNRLTVIGKSAFSGCVNMTGIILPRSLTEIKEKAFAGCKRLISAKIPPSVVKIDADVFHDCPELTIYCVKDSFADQYARKHNIPVKYMPLTAISSTTTDTEDEHMTTKTPLFQTISAPSKNAVSIKDRFTGLFRKKLPMGPMNGVEDKHPVTIIASCYYLGRPLPRSAKCGNQPSHYLGADTFDGQLSSIVTALGDHMPNIDAENLQKMFRRFLEKYKSVTSPYFTNTDLSVYFADWILFGRAQGFNHDDYFDYELYNKEPIVRSTFLDDDYRLHIWQLCANKDYRDYFRVKSKFNAKFRKYLGRDFCNVSRSKFETFQAFLDKHPTFFAKPLSRTGGKGARILSLNDNTAEELYAICREEGLLAEEILDQHESIAAFNESTLNTIRVVTLITADNKPKILWAFARFGRAGNCADNFHSGGVCASMDARTGTIISDAIDRNHVPVTHHPDSGLQFLGFRYPNWKAVKKLVLNAAMVIPEVRHVGWDVAITKDGSPKIIEGNSRSGFAALQAPTQTGRKHLYAKHISEIENLLGKHREETPIPYIDITGMETD